MRRTFAVLGFSTVLVSGALSLVVLPNGATRAAATTADATFMVPASDGYGVAECLVGGAECGQVVAGAWCEAQGYGRVVSFGLASEEVTGAVQTAGRAASGDRPIAITCAN